ncbi:hypothetical protein LTR56_010395 [Elasticomyces elasticus]|nr:hypothetical protein LTR22_024404 [Elasticomyces elasticus]KAK3643021.1 hypothetical protein LTR56_010395 [Elasticomyces elasticus]KAK4916822.1 hypothetical protein LTR49_015266 [Elasticomyces elasticus]KAK5755972.1 hypothetical protein LTS12_013976 [Elasticomyces elasticus]
MWRRTLLASSTNFSTAYGKVVEDETSTFNNLENGMQLEMSVELLGEKAISLGTVRRHSKLADAALRPGERLMEVELPQEMSYACCDNLVVLPTNRSDDVYRVLNRLGIACDGEIVRHSQSVLGSCLELGTPIPRKHLQTVTSVTQNIEQKSELERFSETDAYNLEQGRLNPINTSTE